MKIFVVLMMSFLSACAATMVNPPGGDGSPYGPTNDHSRPGMIKYLNQGADAVIRARREDAYKKMHSACNGRYRIVSEGPNSSGGVATAVGSTVYMSSNEYWFISFECEG